MKYTVDESFYDFDKELGIFSKSSGKYLEGYAQDEKGYLKVSLKGKKLSEETKRKIGEKSKGRKLSEEVKRLLSKLKSKQVNQIDKTTGEIIHQWSSATEAAKQLGYNHSLISACCKGERKTHMGYIWKYPL